MSELSSRVARRYLRILAQGHDAQQSQYGDPDQGGNQEAVAEPEVEGGAFGGAGPFVLPDDHVAAMRVPKGGSCCANCRFGSEDADGDSACTEPNFVAWNGGNAKLPAPPDEYCSDFYQPAPESMEGES